MLLELLEETFRELGCLQGQPTLGAAFILDEQCTIDDALVNQARRLSLLGCGRLAGIC